jgi:uncharacterized membrane protein YfcA
VLAIYLQQWLMLIIFAAMLAYMSYASFTTRNLDDQQIASGEFAKAKQDWLSRYLELRGSYHDLAANRDVEYIVNGSAIGAAISDLAGLASGLLGVGGGVLKVSAMNR